MTDHVLAASRDGMAEATLDIVRGRFRATAALGEGFFAAHAPAIARACENVAGRFAQGGTLYVTGRGAQASDAHHVAVEFVHPVIVGKRALPAVPLRGDGRAHLRALARPGDIVLALCAGAVDPRTAALLGGCHRAGMLTVLLAGAGDTAAQDVDHHFAVDGGADAMGVQEIHETLYHVLWELVHVFVEHGSAGLDRRADSTAAERALYPFLFEASTPASGPLRDQVEASVHQKWRDVRDIRARMLGTEAAAIGTAAGALADRVRRGGRVLAFGNGGSATDAQDAAFDCVAPPAGGWRPIPALDLTADAAVLTAVGNDVGFEHVFARQVESFGRPIDAALGFSTSGASKSVLRAFERARARGMLTIAFSGHDGGPLARLRAVDHCLTAPGDYVPRIQEAHATAWHALLAAAQAALANPGSPAEAAS